MSNTLDELKIKEYCDEYKFKCKKIHDCFLITTGIEEWLISNARSTENNKILVKHFSIAGNKKRKMRFHSQRKAPDLDYVFNNIIKPHGTYNRVFDKAFRIKELLKTI